MGKAKYILQYIGEKIIRMYQVLLSPYLGPCCRFYPSCSEYCLIAMKTHGFLYGLWFTIRRLLRCHPFHPGGFDPVPDSNHQHQN